MTRILHEFDARHEVLEAFAHDVRARLEAALDAHRDAIHSISCRLKSRPSLAAKLARPDRTYRCLDEVTDVVGLRVVTYFEDAIDGVAAAVERAFSVDLARSVDKRLAEDPTRFGYRSLHYICATEGGAAPFEIQVRTLLQHAWAEIEHDLGYKSAESVPHHVRRRFSRLAGLLELADEEFLAIKQFLARYESEVRRGGGPSHAVGLDRVTLGVLARGPLSARVDGAIAAALGLDLQDTLFYPDYLLRMLLLVGFDGVERIEEELRHHEPAILSFLPHYFQFTKDTWRFSAGDLTAIQRGYGLFFLAHLAMLGAATPELDKVRRIEDFYATLDGIDDRADARRVAIRLLEAYRGYRSPGGG